MHGEPSIAERAFEHLFFFFILIIAVLYLSIGGIILHYGIAFWNSGEMVELFGLILGTMLWALIGAGSTAIIMDDYL